MREKIKEIQDYFIKQIIEGNFQTLDSSSYIWKIEVDGYAFCFWIAHGKRGFSQHLEYNLMNLHLTQKQQDEIWETYNSLVYEKNKEEEKIKRKEQYERLKKEFEND